MIEVCRFCRHGEIVDVEIDESNFRTCQIKEMRCVFGPKPFPVQKHDYCGHFKPMEDWISLHDALERAARIAEGEFGLHAQSNPLTYEPSGPYAVIIYTPENRIIRATPFVIRESGRSYEFWDFQDEEKRSQIPVVVKMDLMAEGKFGLDAKVQETCYAKTWTGYRRCLYKLLNLAH